MVKRVFFRFILLLFFISFFFKLFSQSFEYNSEFIEGPLIFSHETIIKGIIKIVPVGKDFSNYSGIELSKVNNELIDPEKWLYDKIYDELGDIAETERLLNSKDSPFSDPVFKQFKNIPLHIKDTLLQLTNDPLVFCRNINRHYNNAGVFF